MTRVALQPVDLTQVLGAAMAQVEPAARAKRIRMELYVECCDHRVVGDAEQLRSVAGNLLSNSIKFTPPRGRVRVRLDRVDEAARLRVDDNGAGIRADFLPRVFEPFARDADSENAGAGLGLTIARDVVQTHGGSIEASSPGPNLGSTFTVELPALIVPPEMYWG